MLYSKINTADVKAIARVSWAPEYMIHPPPPLQIYNTVPTQL